MIAIVNAGGEIEPGNPLYAATHGGLKSMIDVNGKPMIQWVLDALCASTEIDRVVVVGLPPETSLDCAYPLYLLPDQGGAINNVRRAAAESLAIDAQAKYAVLAYSDIPALRGEMVDWLIGQSGEFDQDIYFTVIERPTMEAEFPESKRAYTHLKNKQVCEGYLHCFRLETAIEDRLLWQRLAETRKLPFLQSSILGYDLPFFARLRQLTLNEAETKVSQRLGIKGRVVVSPYSEIGMDIERPAQLEFMRDYLARRYARNAANPQST